MPGDGARHFPQHELKELVERPPDSIEQPPSLRAVLRDLHFCAPRHMQPSKRNGQVQHQQSRGTEQLAREGGGERQLASVQAPTE